MWICHYTVLTITEKMSLKNQQFVLTWIEYILPSFFTAPKINMDIKLNIIYILTYICGYIRLTSNTVLYLLILEKQSKVWPFISLIQLYSLLFFSSIAVLYYLNCLRAIGEMNVVYSILSNSMFVYVSTISENPCLHLRQAGNIWQGRRCALDIENVCTVCDFFHVLK